MVIDRDQWAFPVNLRGVGRTELGGVSRGGGVPTTVDCPPKRSPLGFTQLGLCIIFFFGGGGVPGNLETPLATPLNLPLADGLNGWWQIRVADGTQSLCVLRSHFGRSRVGFTQFYFRNAYTAICAARLLYGRGRIPPVFICGTVMFT